MITIFNPTPESITAHLNALHAETPKPYFNNATAGADTGTTTVANSSAFYLLHPEINNISHVLKSLQDGLKSFSASSSVSIGSFADSPPTHSHTSKPFVSIAIFTPTSHTESITPFRSTITGRPPASVGRWHRSAFTSQPSSSSSSEGSAQEQKREEDLKGSTPGEMERVLLGSLPGYDLGGERREGSGGGWEEVWKSERMYGNDEGAGESGDLRSGLGGIEGLERVESR